MIRAAKPGIAAVTLVPVLAFLLALISTRLMEKMPSFGRFIPQPNLVGDYTRGFIWALFIWLVIAIVPLRERKALTILWPIKIAMTLGVMLFYEQHYGLDAYNYFLSGASSQRSAGLIGADHMIFLSSLAANVVGFSYHSIKVLFSFVGFCACICFYRAAVHFFRRHDTRILYIVVLLPSILFWSSILGKDPVNLLGAGLYALGVCGAIRTSRWLYVVPMIAGIALASYIRPWFVVIMVVPALWTLTLHAPRVSQRLAVLILGAATMAITWSATSTVPLPRSAPEAIDIINTTILGQATPENNGLVEGSGQVREFSSLGELVTFWPMGAFSALYRPLPWEARNVFAASASIEDLFLLLLGVAALRHWRQLVFRDALVQWSIAYLLTWLVFYAFISYGNLGAGARFRLEVLPVLLLLSLLLGTERGRRALPTLAIDPRRLDGEPVGGRI